MQSTTVPGSLGGNTRRTSRERRWRRSLPGSGSRGWPVNYCERRCLKCAQIPILLARLAGCQARPADLRDTTEENPMSSVDMTITGLGHDSKAKNRLGGPIAEVQLLVVVEYVLHTVASD